MLYADFAPKLARVLTEYAIPQRCIYREEIPSLLQAAGFTTVSLLGDFRDEEITDDTDQIVVCARL